MKSWIFWLICVTASAQAQIVIQGSILDAGNNAPLAFTNIGILDSGVGTISNLDGSFSITIPINYSRAKLIVSALGYGRKYFAIDSLKSTSPVTIRLHESVKQLDAITISGNRRFKKHQLGNDQYEGAAFYADTLRAGSSMAILIDNKANPRLHFPANVEEASVRINRNTLKEFKMRVRIMSVDPKTGLPGADIFNRSVVKTSRIKTGWLKFDLIHYNISVDGPFFLVYEWILDESDRRLLHQQFESWKKQHPDKMSTEYSVVNGKQIPYTNYNSNFWAGVYFAMAVSPDILQQYKCYYRYNSFGKWEISPSVITTRVGLSN